MAPRTCPARAPKALRRAPRLRRRAQRGSALVVSLLVLLVLTLLALAGTRSTTLEERMAGNFRDRHLAFQAAETALRDAEAFIEGVASTGAFNGAGGLLGQADPEPDYNDPATWTAGASRAYSGSLPGVASQPRYIIKHLGSTGGASGGSLNIGGYGQAQAGGVQLFRITVQAVGGGAGTRVLLQEHYGRRF
ncbi:MAG: pilus assembly protein PilX [Gammaproteobacteria bacterium]|nr:MAG: pilus assembly protein PilX [Gammaproteobacteria bacterium]